jgi:hypothetical protein
MKNVEGSYLMLSEQEIELIMHNEGILTEDGGDTPMVQTDLQQSF